ncbi:MAG: type II secretion system protein M, partial [Candidatus Omnitrophica bacterium]|nr:type II secretion system protein M [Candidatus Omnitrophota bacterium]
FAKKSRMPLTEESISFLADERNKLKSAYSRLKLALTSPLAEDVPRESMDSLQFKERLIQTQKKLREEAKEFSLSLPDSLGFTKYETELSTRGEIPALWRRLKVLEELIYLMTLSEVVSLNEISFIGDDPAKEAAQPVPAEHVLAGMPVDKAAAQPAQSENFYDEVKVSFKITCTYSGLIKFLYKMRASPFIFIVDDLDITRAKDTLDKDEAAESMLQANFLAKAEIIR